MKYVEKKKKSNWQIDDISPIIVDILNKREIKDIDGFLHPSFNKLYNPFLFRNMKYVVDRILFSIKNNQRIIIHGDYDVDGTMATSSLFLALRANGANVGYFIPNRHKTGYGLNISAIDNIAKCNPNCLIITVDCGITSVDEVAYAKSIGLDVIVTDHHNPKEKLPDCAIIDAKVDGETYPFKELCGAGVIGKIIHAMFGIDYMKKFIDMIAIATIADVVPLIDENRVFVSKGLDFINYMKRPGISALISTNTCEKVTSSEIAFKYAPMINSCGRLGDANDVVRLMTSRDNNESKDIANKLFEYNNKRKDIESNIFQECQNKLGNFSGKSIVLWDEKWESGVIGIVASRLVEKYNCPTVLLAYDNEKSIWSGSGRSITNVNLFNILLQCKSLTQFGGHNAAAGMKTNSPEEFKKEFESICNNISDDVFEEIIEYDTKTKLSSINKKLIDSFNLFQPCGEGNPEIKIMLSDVSLKNTIIRAGKHFSTSVFDETGICGAICFNSDIPSQKDNIDMIVSASINKYRNKESIQLNIHAFMKNGQNLKRVTASADTAYGVRIVDQPIEVLGISSKKIDQFKKAGIETIQQLVNYFPTKYLDFRHTKTCRDLTPIADLCSIIGQVKSMKKGNGGCCWAMCIDENGDFFRAYWFNKDYVLKLMSIGGTYIFCGKAQKDELGRNQIQPLYFGGNIKKYQAIIPEYKKITGMAPEYLMQQIERAIQMIPNTDFLEREFVERFGMLSDYDATLKLHNPKNDFEIRDGQRRKVFNDLFEFNFILKSRNRENEKSNYILSDNSRFDDLKKLLPYNLTGDQDKSINGLYEYMKSGKVLNALVQGDVGSGKTMVALFSLLLAASNNHQSCIIAPTEVLARQHFDEISGYLTQLGYNVGYLVGGMKVRERKSVLKGLEDGSISVVVGTHAIIQDSVVFNDLALVVVDEQHKFGVVQREKLMKIDGPHMISMSATPIPRTLSMATYGDNIQVYSIKEKPAGRKDVITLKMRSDDEINNFMLQQIRKGYQCYVVAPLIEESESEKMMGVRSVEQEIESMYKWFSIYPDVKISNTTGRMKKEDITNEIAKFVANETHILVSTTIIEVGVNVPNSTTIVLKSSERFGLAQAHQLRGRVGRGNAQGYCILQTDYDDPKADVLCETTDGFEIARQDMLLRGTGDYIGTQQTGNNRNVMLMMSEPDLYKSITELNDEIYKTPHLFSKYKYILEERNEL